ncbi:glycosyltransferase [Streptomyces sp. B6B3]|uniref:glycosyltransferase n=1 Tax=Streptomyces sp. B6B3 TaxID=3153570 RepID=UPI00325EEFCE
MFTVLHLAQPGTGGVARVVADLVREQTVQGLRAIVLCPPGGQLERAAAAAGAEVGCWLAERNPGPNLPWETALAARAIRRARPDLVHMHSSKAGLAGRLALRGRLPTVFQPHAWSFEAVEGVGARLALGWERRAAAWTDRVLCVSERERATGEAAGIRARWSVIPNGIDLDRHPVADGIARRQARAALAAVHALPQRAPLVVCVARMCRQKGQDVLLRAWPEVAARVPGAQLALVGDGPEHDRLRSTAARQAVPGVLFVGHTDDTLPWYAAADLVVLPSRWEGMALTPLEAMAVGRPVLLTDVGGARESLPPEHWAECLVPPGEPGPLARGIVALLDDPPRRRTLAREALARVRAAHDLRRTAAACSRLYAELLGLPQGLDRPPAEEAAPGDPNVAVPGPAGPQTAGAHRVLLDRAAPGRAIPEPAPPDGAAPESPGPEGSGPGGDAGPDVRETTGR